MAGLVIETLSNRKLVALGVVLLLIQVAFFLCGGLIAPSPSKTEQVLGTKCINYHPQEDVSRFFWPLYKGRCEKVDSFQDPKIQEKGIHADMVVFAFQFPLPKEGHQLDMSRWFQNIIGVITLDIAYNKEREYDMIVPNSTIELVTQIGYRNKGDEEDKWTMLASSTEVRKLNCNLTSIIHDEQHSGEHYDCPIMPLFELGSCHHDYYLLNIRLPPNYEKGHNIRIGDLKDIWFVAISQNGGFTKVWFTIKSIVFPLLLPVVIWFWRRVKTSNRPASVLEKMLIGLGLSMSFLNFPVEWFTLWFDMPFMLLLTDIRQGVFYTVLMSFWIIFTGEHLMDDHERNRFVYYWRHLCAVAFGCICMFIFELCERGVQLYNPFYSIWASETSTKLAYTFIGLAGVAGVAYFLFLLYMIVRVFRNICAKRSALPNMTSARKRFYQGLMYRFYFLMVLTVLCSAMTVCFYIVSEISESEWRMHHEGYQSLNYTSAFLTGVYGMWNLYVFLLLILYAPSSKTRHVPTETALIDESNEETVELSRLPSEMTSLATFASKAVAD